MKKRISDAKRHQIVKKAIAHAEERAEDDDRTFVRALRRHAFENLSEPAPDAGAARSGGPGWATGRRGPWLEDDPRYLANARALAARTQRNARILGGSDVATTDFDDCVAVGNDRYFGCTGTLIAKNVVLTAGHCEELHTRVFVGNDTRKRGRVYRIARHVRHPRWTERLCNDVMLLVLEKPVAGVKPRALATTAAINAATDARIVGFGTTDTAGEQGYGTKRQTDVPIVSAACRGRVNGQNDGAVYGCHAGKELVAGKPLLLHDTCRGDSGGPLYVADGKGSWLLAGVTSRGTESATEPSKRLCGDGGVYTRVDGYRTWIASVLKRKGG